MRTSDARLWAMAAQLLSAAAGGHGELLFELTIRCRPLSAEDRARLEAALDRWPDKDPSGAGRIGDSDTASGNPRDDGLQYQ